ncbi:MFS transporter [Zooshikella harenae]|uniref:MFS transporter n=1 Tax=Zooshikella harenae TaxID=2827238 RepID=A0ABS5ZD51_9GAMM|nr:MFS transporter [Zooshikella harenae]MBU2712001.1 MFS transporter [Zooshikella harenae]
MKNVPIPIVYCIFLVSFASIGAVIPSALLVSISEHFSITTFYTEKIISVFVLGYAFSQLIYGYIANIYGNKKALYLGITIALAGHLICFVAQTYTALLLGRFISALGSGCGLTITFTLIAEFYRGSEAKKITSYTTSAFAVMPGLAILIGSLISTYLSWRVCFLFMVAYSVLMLYIAISIPYQSTDKSSNKIDKTTFIEDFNEYVYAAVVWGLCGGVVYMLSSSIPVISMNEFKTSSLTFGVLYSFSMLGYFVGNILSARLSSSIPIWKLLYIGCLINVTAALLFVVVAFLGSIIAYYIPIFMIFISLPMIFSTLLGDSMQRVKNKAISSSITSFTCMVLSSIVSMSASSFTTDLYTKITLINLVLCLATSILTVCYVKQKVLVRKELI